MPTLSFKVTDAEAAKIRRAARVRRVSVSAYVRNKLVGIGMPKATRKYNDIITPGRVVIDGLPVTTEQIRAALYGDD